MKLPVKKVAFLLANGYEESEMTNPYDAITKNGHEAVIIGLRKGIEIADKKGSVRYTSHLSARQAEASDYDAVIIPGGGSPAVLRRSKDMVKFVQEADKKGITISAICHGPQLLITAGVLEGRTLTGYAGIAEEIEQAGGHFVNREVVVDEHLITSRDPGDEPAFIQATIDKLGVAAY
ncbi:type 1 glutamine amidotransferase domain-containing protein [Cohnella lupini]|uniref:Protease I n=1 Tax=Cohnella lupini TaxID=1294267 RepID=A0A3D9I3M9_9BACL|nr:type 1 glutamine amidotransferase domain-containing protein [Cohnella lupini]RED56281.1 protease I [Cohnella lupini]